MTAKPKLIVLAAFDEIDGELAYAFDPKQIDNEDRAIREAKTIADKHAGVVAWSRIADPAIGEYGEPAILFQRGKIPEME